MCELCGGLGSGDISSDPIVWVMIAVIVPFLIWYFIAMSEFVRPDGK